MKSRIATLALAAALAAGIVFPVLSRADGPDEQQADPPRVELRGLIVLRPPADDGVKWKTPPLGDKPQTQLMLMVTVPGGRLIAPDESACRLVRLADDRRVNLLAEQTVEAAISEDGRGALVRVRVDRAPSPDARELIAAGELAFHYSPDGKRDTHRTGPFDLKDGAAFKLGPAGFRVRTVTPLDKGAYKMKVELICEQDPRLLGELRFLDEKNAAIPGRIIGWGSSDIEGRPVWEYTFAFTRRVERVTITADGWADLKRLAVPFNLTAGVGLAGGEKPE